MILRVKFNRSPEADFVSGLSEKIWAVLSERGIEADALTYDDAHAMVQQLRCEDVHGLCVITAAAGSRYRPESQEQAEPELQQASK